MDINKKILNLACNEVGVSVLLEAERDIPFPIKRVYYIYGVAPGARRGFHAHKVLEQYLICVSGNCKIFLDNATEKAIVTLNNPSEGLYIGPGIWREMYDFSEDAVLLVLASKEYDENDYLRDYGAFVEYIKEVSKK